MKRNSLLALLVALGIGFVLLVTVVLPVERGYDPTGVGRLLGLTAISGKAQTGVAAPLVGDVTGGNDNLVAVAGGDAKNPLSLPNPAVHQQENSAPRTEVFTVKLDLDQKTEIKAVLGKAKVIIYSWTVEGGQVYVDFHGHDSSKGDAYWVRYQEGDGVRSAQGSLVAPFAGEHGWFWLNVSDSPITIKLTVTGFQDKMINYGLLP